MKKIISLLLALTMLFALSACGAKTAEEAAKPNAAEPAEEDVPALPQPDESVLEGELVVFAAASMTEGLNAVKEAFEKANPKVSIIYNFDSSGTLKTQIQEGAVCDVFISAAQKQMNALDIGAGAEANPDRLDFVLEGTRIDLLENLVGLVVPEGNPKGIESFDQLAELLKNGKVFLAMGNDDVPVGQYTKKILDYYGLNIDELAANGCITYGSNVKEVTSQVKDSGVVDCGVVYCTDATAAGLTVVDTATEEMVGRAIYPAAIMKCGNNMVLGMVFLDYLTRGEGRNILSSYGFSMLG